MTAACSAGSNYSNPTQALCTLSPIKESEDNKTDSLVNVTSPSVSFQRSSSHMVALSDAIDAKLNQ